MEGQTDRRACRNSDVDGGKIQFHMVILQFMVLYWIDAISVFIDNFPNNFIYSTVIISKFQKFSEFLFFLKNVTVGMYHGGLKTFQNIVIIENCAVWNRDF